MATLSVNGKYSSGITVEIDDEDLERCNQYKWWIGTNKDKRVYTKINNKHILLHQFITNFDTDTIDHIDRNPYNNRKSNLREANHYQSAWNRSKHKDSINKYKGVYKTYGDKWIADIMSNGIRYTIGRFKSEEIAAKARDKKAIELHGKFAYLNFPDFDYASWNIPEDDRFKQRSKFRGISYNTRNNVWIVRVQINNVRKYIGSYKTEQEAIEAYQEAKKGL